MKIHHCDRCNVLIEKEKLPLLHDGEGHWPVKDLQMGMTLRMPAPHKESWVAWDDVDLCGGCARDLVVGFMKKPAPTAPPPDHPNHLCVAGVGQKAWHDTFPTLAIVQRNADGTWYCGGGDGDFGVNAAYCPFCGVKLGELAPVEKDGGER